MPLFQKAVQKRFIKELNAEQLTALYEKYIAYFGDADVQDNIRKAKEEQFQEGFLQKLFVDILGYKMLPEPNYNLITEQKNETNNKKADAAILRDGKPVAVIELKSTKTVDLQTVELQAFSYKNQQIDCPFVITSNFHKLRFYIHNAVVCEEFDLFNLTKEAFDVLYLCLSPESIIQKLPLQIQQASIEQEEIISQKFYEDYLLFKTALFEDLVARNKEYDKLTLLKKAQKLLDRILFICFAEDKGFLQPNTIAEIIYQYEMLKELEGYQPLYQRFKNVFGYMNTGYYTKRLKVFAYNGGLFEADKVLDSLLISDNILYNHCQTLSHYDFDTDLDINILGHIFEHSLNELDELTAQITAANFDKTQTKRKKDGIFYTPRYVTKYIIDNTVGKLCQQKKKELGLNDEALAAIPTKAAQKRYLITIQTYRDWLLDISILDPACGSGAFLNQALEFLIEEHLLIDTMMAAVTGTAVKVTDTISDILAKNIYGVDINEESINIAKLSLWLRTAKSGKRLTQLTNTIKCGNSLLSQKEQAGGKAFDWEKEFPEVFEKQGFTVIIGNPPYVRADTDSPDFVAQRHHLETCGEYQTLFEKWDLMVPFYEKTLKLLQPNGLHSFIVSNAITTSKYAFKLQKWILETKNLLSIDYFEGIEVFKGVGVVPIISLIENAPAQGIVTKNLHKNIFNEITSHQTHYALTDDDKEINAFKQAYTKTVLRVETARLGDICYISVGMVINADEKEDKGGFAKDDIISFTKTKLHTKRFVEGKDMDFYRFKRVKFLEWNTNRVPAKLRRPTFKALYEGAKILRGRVTPATYDDTGIVCNDGVIVFKRFVDLKGVDNKSIQGSISKNNDLDRAALELFSEKFELKYLLGIINSKYAFQVLNNNRRHRLENYFYPDDFRQFAVPVLPIEEQQKLVILVDKMLVATENYHTKRTDFAELLMTNFKGLKWNKKIENWYDLSFAEFKMEIERQKILFSFEKQTEWLHRFKKEKDSLLDLKIEIEQTEDNINNFVEGIYQ